MDTGRVRLEGGFRGALSYLLYCGILGYCEGAAAKRFEERARIAGKDASLSVRALLLERMGIDSRRQAVFARMREHFEAYMTGSAVSPAIIKERCLEEGTLLPVGEVMEAFVDGNGTLPTEREEAFAKVGGGFFEKLMGVFRRTILKRAH